MSYSEKVPPVETNQPGADEPTSALSSAAPRRRRRHAGRFKRLRRRLHIRIRWLNVLIVMVAVTAVLVVAVLALVFDSTNRVQSSLASFQRVVDSLSSRPGTELTLDDFQRLSASVSDLSGSLSTARSRLSFLTTVSSLNKNLQTTLVSLDAARQLAMAAHDMLNGLQPTLFFLVAGSDTDTVVTELSSGERVVELLRIGRGQFASASDHLASAQKSMGSLDLSHAPANVLQNIEQLNTYLDELNQINNVLIGAPDVLNAALGLSGERNYLILSQNNDELRPSGGYLSTYGWITVRDGRVTNYAYSATTTTSPNPPTATLASQLNIPSWWLQYREPIYAAWDGSWFSDFPSTARMAMWYYNTGNNPQSPVDGAIAIDITGFEELLGVLGSVTVPGYTDAVTPDNFRTVVYDIRDYGGGDEPHKQFIAALFQQIFSEWQNMSLDPTKNTALLGAMLQALQEKHIMMYFSDDQLNKAVDLLGWSGAQTPATNHDYLMVSDANLGNKSNHSIARQLTYDVDIQPDGSVNGRATIAYDYSARVANTDPAVNPEFNGPADYNNLLQVYLPVGTTLTGTTNIDTPPTVVDNQSNTDMITRLYIPFDSSPHFQFSYTTPPLVENLGAFKRYRLLVQKQPGTGANPVDVQVLLPAGASLISSSPTPVASYELDRPVIEFRFDLSTDHWIEIIYQD